MTTLTQIESDLAEQLDEISENIQKVRDAAGSVIFGQDRVIELALISVLAGGHALMIGVPGLAKTRLVETLGTILGLEYNRIQFTPDLMPADITGSEMLEGDAGGRREFRFIKGPVFTQLLLADEINRTAPKTQSALLEAMQEHHVTVAGKQYDLPAPFHVLATQNPLEQEGTYPLPEAQLDRFLLQIDFDYPDIHAERQMLYATTGTETTKLKAVLSAKDLMRAQRFVRQIPIGESVIDAILKLVRSARPGPDASEEINANVAWGPGPRASQALTLAARAKALTDGRESPSIDDVIQLAEPILKHRMALTFAARNNRVTIPQVIESLARQLE